MIIKNIDLKHFDSCLKRLLDLKINISYLSLLIKFSVLRSWETDYHVLILVLVLILILEDSVLVLVLESRYSYSYSYSKKSVLAQLWLTGGNKYNINDQTNIHSTFTLLFNQ